MVIQGTYDKEWRRLYRVAVAEGAISRETAVCSTKYDVGVLVWYKSGREYDTIFAIREDGKAWPGRDGNSADYACIA